MAIRNKIGQNDLNIKFKDTYLANRYFFSKKGKLNKIYGLNKIRKKAWIKKLKIFSSVGEKLSRTTNHTNRIGVFIVQANSLNLLERRIKLVYKNIRFKIT